MDFQQFNYKNIIIAPYTKTSDTFRQKLQKDYPQINVIGFSDKVQKGENIYTLTDIKSLDIDCIFILSSNHFNSIYKEYSTFMSQSKLFKINIVNNSYQCLGKTDLFIENFKNIDGLFKRKFYHYFSKFLDVIHYKRNFYVFISKHFINGNNKFLYLYMQEHAINSVMLSSNLAQCRELQKNKLKVYVLTSWKAYFFLSLAKIIIVDQGDNNQLLSLASKNQKLFQQWHGIPLEHMNLLTEISYDYFLSTSDYVSNSSFNRVFLAKNFMSAGYPRNDILLKNRHTPSDLIFTDKKIYHLAKEKFFADENIVVYMPTFRESDFTKQSTQLNSMALDFAALNHNLKEISTTMIIKLHPFVMAFYQNIIKIQQYSHILFHSIEGDIYPVLKYAHILITDYSSVYADFLLLNRPIIFYLYDHGQCSKMSHGYLYEFDQVSPGEKAYNQADLLHYINKIINGNDIFSCQRKILKNKFFEHSDALSSQRILEYIEHEKSDG